MSIKAVVFDAYGTLYDIQSVASVTEDAFPGYGEIITQIWRIKQLEYTWLRSLMRRYQDFSLITRDSLAYTLRCLGLESDPVAFERIIDKYLHLESPDAYTLIESTLNVPPANVLFISSNPWDACGAKSFGLNVAWIERVTPQAMALACVESDVLPPLTMFKAIRTQMDELGFEPDYRIHALSELPALVSLRS